jgi:hypothetical protein
MLRVVLDSIRLSPTIRVDQLRDNQAVIADAVRFSYSKRVALNSLDRTPDIDNLHASLK